MLLGCTITKAEYYGSGAPANRKQVRIYGSNLKLDCTSDDVESKGVDEAGKESPVKKATHIISSRGIQCEAAIAHLAAWEKTLVRIKCNDNSWSNWQAVAK